MTLQEAIEHAKEVSSKECSECKKEHEQLANWLEELKNIKDILGNNYDLNMLQEILNICDGKTPSQIKEIFEEWSHYLKFAGKMNAIEETVDSIYDDGKIDYDRLLELVEADKDGRCIVLPKECPIKIGERIWYADTTRRKIESGIVYFPIYKDGRLDTFSVKFDNGLWDDFFGCELETLAFTKEEDAKEKLEKDLLLWKNKNY